MLPPCSELIAAAGDGTEVSQRAIHQRTTCVRQEKALDIVNTFVGIVHGYLRVRICANMSGFVNFQSNQIDWEDDVADISCFHASAHTVHRPGTC